ncbi:MAG: MAPEG family protein [Myxococcota bacterium]
MLELPGSHFPITSLYAALLGFVFVALSIHVVRARLKHEVSIGHGGIDDLHLAQRRQGNFVEYVPYALVLLVLLEASNTSAWILHALGGGLLFARILHPFGFYPEFALRLPRLIGTVVTWIVLASGSAALLYGALAGGAQA